MTVNVDSLNENFWLRLFPASDYRMPMNVYRGNAQVFWSNSSDAHRVSAERRRWLDEAPQRHLLFSPEAQPAIAEAVEWFSSLLGQSFADARDVASRVEPDWVLLNGDVERGFPVLGGAVVFPSNWALKEKLHRPLAQVHEPVPGLSAALGSQITTFLSRIAPGSEWERSNWGLSAEPLLNHHPALHPARLHAGVTLDTTWLRLERQFLTRLPHTQTILFGIRVTNHRLDELLCEHPVLIDRIAHAIRSMPDAMTVYKNVSTACDILIHQLATTA